MRDAAPEEFRDAEGGELRDAISPQAEEFHDRSQLPADVLSGVPLKRKAICRTFSDCTTGPRLGLVSGCYPLDPFYEAHPDGARLRACKAT